MVLKQLGKHPKNVYIKSILHTIHKDKFQIEQKFQLLPNTARNKTLQCVHTSIIGHLWGYLIPKQLILSTLLIIANQMSRNTAPVFFTFAFLWLLQFKYILMCFLTIWIPFFVNLPAWIFVYFFIWFYLVVCLFHIDYFRIPFYFLESNLGLLCVRQLVSSISLLIFSLYVWYLLMCTCF